MKTLVLPMPSKALAGAAQWLPFVCVVVILLSACSPTTTEITPVATSVLPAVDTTTDFAYAPPCGNIGNGAGSTACIGSATNQPNTYTQWKDYLAPIAPKPQTFVIAAPQADTTIVGKKGVKVTIPANSFAVPANTPVEVKMTEYTTKADMLFANLSTTSNGRLLESGGSVYITATAFGKSVDLAEGKALALAFPTKNVATDMQTFYGQQTPKGINWVLPKGNEAKLVKKKKNPLNYPIKSVRVLRNKQFTDTYQKHSNITTHKYQLRGWGSHHYITKLVDSVNYSNSLDNLNFTTDELKKLEGIQFSYDYTINNDGMVTDIGIKTYNFLIKRKLNKKEKLLIKAKADLIKALISSMPKAEPSQMNYAKGSKKNREYITICFRTFETAKSNALYNVHKMPYTLSYIAQVEETVYIADTSKAGLFKFYAKLKTEQKFNDILTNKMGWINCDRLVNAPTQEFAIVNTNPNLMCTAVYSKIKSVQSLCASNTVGQTDFKVVLFNASANYTVSYAVVPIKASDLTTKYVLDVSKIPLKTATDLNNLKKELGL